MEKGHIEYDEILFVLLLMAGLAAAALVLLNAGTANLPSDSDNLSASPAAGNSPPSENAAATGGNESAASVSGARPEVTTKTLDELLSDGLARGESWFYGQAFPGNYTFESFKWTLGASNESPDAIPVQENDIRASVIRFNGRYIDSLRGFSFTVYTPADVIAQTRIRGTAVFLSDSTVLDGYFQNSSGFTMTYDPHPRLSQILDDCTAASADEFLTGSGNSIKVYDFYCKLIYPASP